jgi:hypothetical protein
MHGPVNSICDSKTEDYCSNTPNTIQLFPNFIITMTPYGFSLDLHSPHRKKGGAINDLILIKLD